MNGADALACYGQLAATVSRMLELARALKWAQLPVLDAYCSELFAQLRACELEGALSAPERARAEALTLRIRQDQEVLQGLLRPQFQHLARRMYETHGGR